MATAAAMDWNARHAARRQGRSPRAVVSLRVESPRSAVSAQPRRQGHLGPHDQRANTLESLRQARAASKVVAAAAADADEAAKIEAAADATPPAQSALLRDIAARGDVVHLLAALDAPDASPIDEPSRSGMTALHSAADRGQDGVVRLLLERGAEVGAVTASGDTALHLACLNGHLATCKTLLEFSTDELHAVRHTSRNPQSNLHLPVSLLAYLIHLGPLPWYPSHVLASVAFPEEQPVTYPLAVRTNLRPPPARLLHGC